MVPSKPLEIIPQHGYKSCIVLRFKKVTALPKTQDELKMISSLPNNFLLLAITSKALYI